MEKNGKFKKVLAFISSIFDLTTESAGIVRPGMYYYSDRTISADVIQGKQISGVVGWVDDSGRHGLVLGLREESLPWSSTYLDVSTPENAGGRENTRLILDAVQKESKRAYAAEWCAAYVFDGIHFEEAFLPSRDELIKIFKNINRIQAALERIGRPLCRDAVYWSSSEDGNYYAWVVRPSDGGMYSNGKYGYNYRVRCVLAF